MGKKLRDDAINGYETVLEGNISGKEYLTEFIDKHRMTDDELLYVVYMAAETISQRQISLVSNRDVEPPQLSPLRTTSN